LVGGNKERDCLIGNGNVGRRNSEKIKGHKGRK
jgi:hypothetical protein